MSGPFNKRNPFGKHCIFALIPGWGFYSGSGVTAEGAVSSVGQKFIFKEGYVGTSGSMERVNGAYGHLGQLAALRMLPAGYQEYIFLLEGGGPNLGISFPNKRSFTIMTIIKPSGDGRVGGSGDPRVFTKDSGVAEVDHDLMVGIASLGQEARTRIRIGSSTFTAITSGAVIEDDALNLIAGSAGLDSGGDTEVRVAHLSEAGIYTLDQTDTFGTDDYNPRTTTSTNIGGSAGALDNAYIGDIIGIWAFDTQMDSEVQLRAFFANPWQVFAPQRIVIPMIGDVVIAEEGQETTVIITDVNGTEAWLDGAENLVISGSGFA